MKYSDEIGMVSEYKGKVFLIKLLGPEVEVVGTERFSGLDKRGIDLIGYKFRNTPKEVVVAVAQVKTTEAGAEEFVSYPRFDQRITVIVAPTDGRPTYLYHKGKILE